MSMFRRAMGGLAALAAGALLLAACGGTTKPTTKTSGSAAAASSTTVPASKIQKGGTATFALGPTATPNWIFPLMSFTYFSVANISNFQYLMYKPLYYFGVGEKPVVNNRLSLAYPPKWTNGGRSVIVTLKPDKWSDGEPVSAKDVELWQNMVTAEKANWAAYVPGAYPDNVVSTKVLSPTSIEFNLNNAYSHQWFLYNELSQITPFPEAWDVTKLGAKPGSGGCTTDVKKCPAVYKFLISQGKKGVATYASSPIWSVVDGAWKLQSLDTTGRAVFTANPKYTGPDKPHLSKFVELPFTTDTAEYNDLRSGNSIDVGYIPAQDVAQRTILASRGYTFKPWTDFGFDYFEVNLNNPTVGPIFRQAYIRQVLEELIDQKGDIKAYYKGYGYPTCGPVPADPPSQLTSPLEKKCPFSFNPKRAAATLRSHGWTVVPNGVDTCTDPTKCGPGIKKGAKLDFQYVYSTGIAALTQSIETEVSDSAKVGIKLSLSGTTFDDAISKAAACKPSQSSCSWEIVNWGGGWVYAPDYYPTGGELYKTGAGSNTENYSSKTMDNLIQLTHLNKGNALQNLYKYEDYAVEQLPVIWQPNPDYQLMEIKSNLHGFSFNTYLNINPSDWYFTK